MSSNTWRKELEVINQTVLIPVEQVNYERHHQRKLEVIGKIPGPYGTLEIENIVRTYKGLTNAKKYIY